MTEQNKSITKKEILECINFVFDITDGPAVEVKSHEDKLYFYNFSGQVVGTAPMSDFFN